MVLLIGMTRYANSGFLSFSDSLCDIGLLRSSDSLLICGFLRVHDSLK